MAKGNLLSVFGRMLTSRCANADACRNETSLGMIFNSLRRMEAKIDDLSIHRETSDHATAFVNPLAPQIQTPFHADSDLSPRSLLSQQSQDASGVRDPPTRQSQLSFSAHQTIHWPGIQASLPSNVSMEIARLAKAYPTHLESNRPSFSPNIAAQAGASTTDWLSSLSLSAVKDLSNAYFDTFNHIFPFIDRDYYFLNTLAVVVREGFGSDMESCLVLNVMALGCMGLRAFEEGGFDMSLTMEPTALIHKIMEEDVPGSSFFNESRRRVGLCLCERDIQSCQYYLTSAVYYAQAMRPVDTWMMTNRASTSCAAFWKCPPEPLDEWTADMQSRLFWSAQLIETVVVQEMELPPSGLKELEDIVPLPKFMVSPFASKSRLRQHDGSYYHYHFLAQIAHRIILTRIRDEIFFTNPSATLADELWHQLEQWRVNLPQALQPLDRNIHPFSCPAEAVAVSLLETRYRVSFYHLGRPFLFKALQNPASLTDHDLKMCSEAFRYAMEWPLCMDSCGRMKAFMPLKYFAAAQFFGQLFIFYAFKNANDTRLRDTLPLGYDSWCSHMLHWISELAPFNPTLSKDLELLSMLYSTTD